METGELFNTSPESILIVNRRGLKRLKCPFTVLLVISLEDLEEGEAYEVRLVLPHAHFQIVYVITVGVNAGGCGGPNNTKTINITVNPDPTVSVSTTNTLICSSQTATLTANGANTYSWSTSATTSITAVTLTITTTYSVIGTATNGCQSTVTITQSVSACTGVSEMMNGIEIDILPNPNNGEFTVVFNKVSQNLSIEIYNAIGQMIKQERLSELNTKINLKEQASGVYFIKLVRDNELVYQTKVIKN